MWKLGRIYAFAVFCVLIRRDSEKRACLDKNFCLLVWEKVYDSSREMYSYHISPFLLKRLASPSVEKRCAKSSTPERGRTTTQQRQGRRDRDQERTVENKENIAVPEKDVEIFALPPPRTPVSSKKNARPGKNVLTTPNQNINVDNSKTNTVTPKGKKSFLGTQQTAVVSVHRTVCVL